MDDVIICTGYVAHAEGDMCHDDVNMMMWQHQRLPRVTHFWTFSVNHVDQWKSAMWQSVQPRGRPYNLKGAMWPSHGLPRGSGKMPNEAQQPKLKKKKWGLAGANPQSANLT
jgi:hypothetical protein